MYDPGYGHPAVYDRRVYEPAHVEYPPHRAPNPVATVAGAAIGAVIGGQLGDRHSRGATTAIGAVIGGIIGSQF